MIIDPGPLCPQGLLQRFCQQFKTFSSSLLYPIFMSIKSTATCMICHVLLSVAEITPAHRLLPVYNRNGRCRGLAHRPQWPGPSTMAGHDVSFPKLQEF